MSSSPSFPYDVLCVGEIVIDLISIQPTRSLRQASIFKRYLGGAPANVARNVAALGGRSALVAAVGEDELGEWALTTLKEAGVSTEHVVALPHPTTLVLITRHTTTPHFLVYRGADRFRALDDLSNAVFSQAHVLHTSAFALSCPPLRDVALHAMRVAREAGCLVSFDPNFHPHLWEHLDHAHAVIAEAIALSHIVKPSLDDCQRLFGVDTPVECARRFLAWGAHHVYVTSGPAGTWWFSATGEQRHIPPREVSVVDVTGAGDAFWAGLLMAWLDGLSPYEAGKVAQHLAEQKLQRMDTLSGPIDRDLIYTRVREGR